jgi:hypothetical protein
MQDGRSLDYAATVVLLRILIHLVPLWTMLYLLRPSQRRQVLTQEVSRRWRQTGRWYCGTQTPPVVQALVSRFREGTSTSTRSQERPAFVFDDLDFHLGRAVACLGRCAGTGLSL